jgi:hypothetical protein
MDIMATAEAQLAKVEELLKPSGRIFWSVAWHEAYESYADALARVQATPGYDPEANNFIVVLRDFAVDTCPLRGRRHTHAQDAVQRYPSRPEETTHHGQPGTTPGTM